MEARQTWRGNAAPKGLIVLCAVGAVLGLAVAGAQVSKNIGRSSATESVIVHPAPGTVLRQDVGGSSATESVIARPAPGTVLRQDVGGSPALLDRGAEASAAQASQAAPAGAHGVRTSGDQSIVDNVSGQADGHGPDSDLTRALPSQTTSGSSAIGLAHGNRYI